MEKEIIVIWYDFGNPTVHTKSDGFKIYRSYGGTKNKLDFFETLANGYIFFNDSSAQFILTTFKKVGRFLHEAKED